MEWQHPEALYLILPLSAAWLLLVFNSNRRRKRAQSAFAAEAMWSRIMPEESRLQVWTKLLLQELAIVTGLVALAGPRFGTQYETVVPRGADLYFLIDVSRSMLAEDVSPSRLGRAKTDVLSLLNRLQGERVGLIAFAGQAVVKSPLTVDYDSFRRSLEELDTDSAPRGGTAIGDAIRKGLEVFHANADRDQAMILITDGDDQQSYPLEAAAVAKERQVTIFTIGLGDSEQGARVPQKGAGKSYLEYQGEQVWSKLESNLLEQIALKTSGVYIPAGTRSYDLGELYSNHLQGRHGHDAVAQQKIRRSERFQVFLALSLAALLIDLCISRYRKSPSLQKIDRGSKSERDAIDAANSRRKQPAAIASVLLLIAISSPVFAAEPAAAVREGLRLYSQEQFEDARTQFAAATEELDKRKLAASAIAAFDEACAAHRKGDLEHARECYLRAGLSTDRSIAVAAHYNLGMLAADKAKATCGENPQLVAAEQRKEILEQLSLAIVAYRHCLELQSDHTPSRRNIELVRQWIKYYTDRWRELDRQKRRDESNLLKFLEFLIQTQTSLKETVSQLKEPVRSNTFAELKRAQEELNEELPTLREKIDQELRPKQESPTGTAKAAPEELDEGIKLLQSWTDTASEKMSAASRRLGAKDPAKAIIEQTAAVEELDRIWDAVIPFHPLLAKDLADQTMIARTLAPAPSDLPKRQDSTDDPGDDQLPSQTEETPETPASPVRQPPAQIEIAEDDFHRLEDLQARTLKRTQLLAPKAESELKQLEATPAAPAADEDSLQTKDPGSGASQVDPEQVKAGYRKAIELAPQAVEKMEAAIKSLKQKDRQAAAERTEEARQILEEIQQAQPKNDQKNEQNQQDQKKDNSQDQSDQNQDQQKKDDEKKSDENPSDSGKNDEDKKNDDKKTQDQKQTGQKPQVSPDRVEDALRKVRERQQEKRERDRKLKGLFLGKTPVDKDW